MVNYRFSEVFSEAQMMCKYVRKEVGGSRSNCQAMCCAKKLCRLYLCHTGLESLEEEAEAVMEWAEKHPEPEFPSWWEWLVEQKVIFPDEETAEGCVQSLRKTQIDPVKIEKLRSELEKIGKT